MRRIALVVGLFVTGAATALDFRSVMEPALLYDAPSQHASPLLAIARGTPVEAVVVLDAWVKVRDAKGGLAWIEKRLLTDRRNVMVRDPRVSVLSQPDEKSATVFEAERDVLLELIDPAPAGWAKVKHRDGQQGFVKAGQVWGL
jgi:SH3-like domain-containing protein